MVHSTRDLVMSTHVVSDLVLTVYVSARVGGGGVNCGTGHRIRVHRVILNLERMFT